MASVGSVANACVLNDIQQEAVGARNRKRTIVVEPTPTQWLLTTDALVWYRTINILS